MGQDSDEAIVLGYLRAQNRPYSATDVFNNLHKQVGKTGVQRTLESLAAGGQVKEKVYGKQKVYVIEQSNLSSVSEGELAEMDAQVAQLQQELRNVTARYKTAESDLAAALSARTTDQVKTDLEALSATKATLSARVGALEAANAGVSPEQRHAAAATLDTSSTAFRKRKRMAMDMLNTILEGYPKPKKQLFEEVGIETDEEVGFQPSKQR